MESPGSPPYQFHSAAVTKHHTLHGLKLQKVMLLKVLEGRRPESK